ncbi:MAG: circadian clock KaiB family protein [Nitrospirales bacterium]
MFEEQLEGRYTLEVIDTFKDPHLAEADKIVATPTLIKEIPAPLRKVIGNLSNTEKVLMGIDLKKT